MAKDREKKVTQDRSEDRGKREEAALSAMEQIRSKFGEAEVARITAIGPVSCRGLAKEDKEEKDS
jgi:hypothetical protein